MIDLRENAVQSWLRLLPDDLRSVLGEVTPDQDGNAAALVGDFGDDPAPDDVLAAVEKHQDSILSLGRARRVRFLAWFARRTYPHSTGAFEILTDEDGGEDGVLGKAGPVFAEDIRAIVAVLGIRAARQIADVETIEMIAGAGFEVTSEMEMRQGGSGR